MRTGACVAQGRAFSGCR